MRKTGSKLSESRLSFFCGANGARAVIEPMDKNLRASGREGFQKFLISSSVPRLSWESVLWCLSRWIERESLAPWCLESTVPTLGFDWDFVTHVRPFNHAVSTVLVKLHLCTIYLFIGMTMFMVSAGKLERYEISFENRETI